MSLGFYVDLASCIGCKTCQVACKDRRDIQVAGPACAGWTPSNADVPGGGHVPPEPLLQPLREPGLRGELPHGRHVQGR